MYSTCANSFGIWQTQQPRALSVSVVPEDSSVIQKTLFVQGHYTQKTVRGSRLRSFVMWRCGV